jgi:hypothetical protein
VLSACLVFLCLVDALFALTVEWSFILTASVMIGALAVALSWHAAPAWRLLVVSVSVAATIGVRYLDWDSRKPFLRDLYSLQVGMTPQEVEAKMRGYLRGTGWPQNPFSDAPLDGGELEIGSAQVYRHTNEGWGNSDWGIVRFDGGVLVGVEFSPD